MTTYLAAFFLTLVIEGGVALALGYRERLLLGVLVLVNVVTHPVLNALLLVNAHYRALPDFPLLVALEIAVVFAEAHLLRDTLRDYPRSLLRLSLWMNGASFAAGVLLYWV